MKNYYINLCFQSGFGDFYTYVCEVYNIARELKKRNYSVILFVKCKEGINFFNLFESDFYKTFDFIEVNSFLIDLETLPNSNCLYPKDYVHGNTHWGLFGDDMDDNIIPKHFNLISHHSLNFNEFDTSLKLSETTLKNTETFLKENSIKDFCVIHFRLWDDMADIMNSSIMTNNIPEYFSVRGKTVKSDNILKEEVLNKLNLIINEHKQVIVCSNSIYLKKYVKQKFSKVIIIEENLISFINRCYTDNHYLELCLLEFSIMAYAKKIYTFTDYSWITNFVSYAVLSHIKTNKFNPYLSQYLIENTYGFLNENTF